jgi:hypothetical protein
MPNQMLGFWGTLKKIAKNTNVPSVQGTLYKMMWKPRDTNFLSVVPLRQPEASKGNGNV